METYNSVVYYFSLYSEYEQLLGIYSTYYYVYTLEYIPVEVDVQ